MSPPDISSAIAFFVGQIVFQVVVMIIAIALAFGLTKEKE